MKKWDMQVREGNYTHTMRLLNPHVDSLGDTYEEEKMCFVNLIQHESVGQIIDTIVHEDLHVALKRINMSIDYEHELIRKCFQVQNDLY